MSEAQNSSGAATLIEKVCRHPKVRVLGRGISDGRRRSDVTGLKGSSSALVIEALRSELGRQLVVVCPDGERAEDMHSDLHTVSPARIRYFPEKDLFPQRFELRENLTVRGQRNAALDQVHQGNVDVLVTSLSGFLEKTIPVDVLAGGTRTIAVGERIDIEDLFEYLTDVGYERTPAIDELGQFSVRGSIIDIFDPSWENPARIELFDDEVESIRAFDIDSQRSLHHLESVRMLPASGALVDSEALGQLDERLTSIGLDRDAVDEIKHEVEYHRFSYLSRRYAPLLGMAGKLLDYYEEQPLVVFLDEAGLGAALTNLEDELDKIKNVTEAEAPLLDFSDYLWPADYYTEHELQSVHIWEQTRAKKKGEDEPPLAIPEDHVRFHTAEHPSVLGKIDALVQILRRLRNKGIDIHVYSESSVQRERLADMLEEDEALVHLPVGWVASGFIWEDAQLAILTDHEIFQRMLPRPVSRRKTRRAQGYQHDQLQTGDFVVHVDYGIGRYVGLEHVTTGDGETECLSLRYAGDDRIFVPVDQMPLVEKYVGKEGVNPVLDRLGSSKWQRTKAKTRKALEDVAADLLRVYAEREMASRPPFGPDTQWQKELEASFPFEETRDQLTATAEIKADMQASKPMERLVCGDVGFGKTEVAIRAAFKAVDAGKQVAVMVPTTILAFQHFRTFKERMSIFPVRVEMLSRFKSAAEQKKTIEALKIGEVDIVIGTHRLLSKDVAFNDLGLLIVDEEHRFGVASKEKLKRMKKSVDIMSMTATPIPRTLYMALSGLRPISTIETPPRNRHPVKTEVMPFDEDIIERAIRYEVARKGQVFFVHNRVASIYSTQAFLQGLMPDVSFGVAHGQMSEKELESAIMDFLEGKFQVLVCTTIIESGLDFPNVNTIVINRADRFGLAELYQLRGRVGRRERQAFAYLMVPRNFAITANAGKRLQAMEDFEELGSGYRLAMRDLEIRGAGNVLGLEQHGQMAAVGFDLYCKMLRETVGELQGQQREEVSPCRIETKMDAFLAADYVEEQNERMAIYKRLARLEDADEVDGLEAELADRFGAPPTEATNLLELTRMKLWAMHLGIDLVQFRQGRTVMTFRPGKALTPHLCAHLVETFGGRVLFKASEPFVLTLAHASHGFSEARELLRAGYFFDRDASASPQNPAESS